MIRNVWLSADVVKSLVNRDATLTVCRNTVTQYMIDFCKRHDILDDTPRFDHDACAVALEAIAEANPHLRNLLDAQVNRSNSSEYGDMVVRFSVNIAALMINNPGAKRLH